MSKPTTPTCTYRLQFNRNFTFKDATKMIPYLRMLGVSHIYASPFLKARAGSPHGYDIVDHNALNPEIGSDEDFALYINTLHKNGMGQILDIVPNHMGVGGDDNQWWLDTLENGEASPYSAYFDIDWHPSKRALRNKVLLPFLGDHYGSVLEKGELQLGFDEIQGSFSVRYYEHLFPIDPRTYPHILAFGIERLEQQLGNQHEAYRKFTEIINLCRVLPRRIGLSAVRRQVRQEGIRECKRRLSTLCANQSEIGRFINENVNHFNGEPGNSESFDLLHELLESQAYRPSYWLVASDEINYRRFFDINHLAGVRMENLDVFNSTHRYIGQLISEHKIDGLRIDHPDGLYDPYSYCCELQRFIHETKNGDSTLFPVFMEKILAIHEHLPQDWSASGTTGYEVAHIINGLFVFPDAEHTLSQFYSRFSGQNACFDDLLYERKKLIIHSSLSSELTVLANLLSSIAQADRHTRDFTFQGLRDALSEVVACFPVYRTYITEERITNEDHHYIHWAIKQAKKRSPAGTLVIFDFINEVLIKQRFTTYSSNPRRKIIHFILRFQQYTAPVMAKGMEDTAFYVYNRLVSLNDVGFDPRCFGLSPNAFHHANAERANHWPHAMVATSTHDSKRSEDVRLRISVLSEIADDWTHNVMRWTRLNRSKKKLVNDTPAPSRNDEYLLYQTLIGSWPLEPMDSKQLEHYEKRIDEYMLKAIREAKVYTSWVNSNEEYEDAMHSFVHALLSDQEHNAFLNDFLPLQERASRFALFHGLSQTLLKLTVPGIPDIYQGNEYWQFNLVDPDNRKPVNFKKSQDDLETLAHHCNEFNNLSRFSRDLLNHIEDGHAKLFLTWKTLSLRRRYPELFCNGHYLPLTIEGKKQDHLCAFARRLDKQEAVIIVSRWLAQLLGDEIKLPPPPIIWENALIEAPSQEELLTYKNIFTGKNIRTIQQDDKKFFLAAEALEDFPVALLIN